MNNSLIERTANDFHKEYYPTSTVLKSACIHFTEDYLIPLYELYYFIDTDIKTRTTFGNINPKLVCLTKQYWEKMEEEFIPSYITNSYRKKHISFHRTLSTVEDELHSLVYRYISRKMKYMREMMIEIFPYDLAKMIARYMGYDLGLDATRA